MQGVVFVSGWIHGEYGWKEDRATKQRQVSTRGTSGRPVESQESEDTFNVQLVIALEVK